MDVSSPEVNSIAAVAALGEAFVLAWSSMPADLPEKISTTQLRALIAVRRGDGATVTDLARTLGALPSSATRLCDRLAAAGYIERSPNPSNRRFHAISLTSSGEQLLELLDRHRELALATAFEQMPDRARRQLRDGLAAFAAQSTAEQDAPGTPALRIG